MGWQLDCACSMQHGLYVVVHEICHNEEMDYLWKHKPVAYILWKKAHCSISIQLGVCEDPENYEEYSRNGLGSNEMWGIRFNITFLMLR